MASITTGEVNVSNAHFNWKIPVDLIMSETRQGVEIKSPTFTTILNETGSNSWQLTLYPGGDAKTTKGWMGLFLTSNNDEDVDVTYSFSLLTRDREKTNMRTSSRIIKSREGWGHSNFIPKKFAQDSEFKYIQDGKITISCSIVSNTAENLSHDNNFVQSMSEKLFSSKKHSDVTVTASNGVQYFLHKCILATQSSVFEAMFDTDMQEKKENLVKIDDVDPSVLYQFFKFIYTGKIDNIKDIVRDLLFVAERYDVIKLKDMCEETMSHGIDFDTALDYLQVAEINNAKKLKDDAIQFVATNIKIFNSKPEFKNLTLDQYVTIIDRHVKQCSL